MRTCAAQQPCDFAHLDRRLLLAGFAEGRASQTRQNRDIGCWKEFGNGQKLNFVDFAAGRFGRHREPRS
jgi:hypothetical protein